VKADSYSYPVNGDLEQAGDNARIRYFWILVLLGAHVPLAYLMRLSRYVATAHALIILILGLWFIVRDKQPYRLIYLTGYIAGADVLWRMTKAVVFWEFGKYAICLLLVLAILKWRTRRRFLPLLYGLLLLPSIFLTVSSYSLGIARKEISFNLSGPITLAITAFFFSGVKLSRQDIWKIILYTIMPVTGILFLAIFKMYSLDYIHFTADSTSLTSGGFGPNQVAAVLGLGALLCWLFIVTQEKFSLMCWVVSGFMIGFLTQAFLTFSRGGVYNFFIAAPLATFYLIKKRQKVLSILGFSALILCLFIFLIIPKMEHFTGGMFGERFSETSTTGRWELIKLDLKLWKKNFLFGVGPGVSGGARFQADRPDTLVTSSGGEYLAAHTEYSRCLAEHGFLGLMALFLLGLMFLQAFLRASTPWAKGLTLAFMVWSLMEMSHAAMRLAAISYFYGLPFANFEDES
jgi:hypothetical protein